MMAVAAEPRIQGAEGAPLPAHIAVIMDGNGRWARARRLPRTAGHKEGVDAVRRIVRAAGDLGIRYLTLYAFSSENWRRPETEVSYLWSLIRLYIREDVAELAANGVKLNIIGNWRALSPDLVGLLEDALARTAQNSRMVLTVALNYGGQDELLRAAASLAADAKAGLIDPAALTAGDLAARLDTAGLPDPDLVIRTSGEKRLSNFLLWQAAYAELVFIDKLWPDFTQQDLEAALSEYQARERRYGASG